MSGLPGPLPPTKMMPPHLFSIYSTHVHCIDWVCWWDGLPWFRILAHGFEPKLASALFSNGVPFPAATVFAMVQKTSWNEKHRFQHKKLQHITLLSGWYPPAGSVLNPTGPQYKPGTEEYTNTWQYVPKCIQNLWSPRQNKSDGKTNGRRQLWVLLRSTPRRRIESRFQADWEMKHETTSIEMT